MNDTAARTLIESWRKSAKMKRDRANELGGGMAGLEFFTEATTLAACADEAERALIPAAGRVPALARGDRELLRSYANGPRIWDAASIVPDVYRLHEQGLIEPVPGELRGAYQLTEAGRQALTGNQED